MKKKKKRLQIIYLDNYLVWNPEKLRFNRKKIVKSQWKEEKKELKKKKKIRKKIKEDRLNFHLKF